MRIIDKALAPYEIAIDGSNHSIEERTKNTDKNGDVIFKNHGYYSNIGSAINRVTYLKLDNNQTMTLSDFLKDYRKIKNELIKTVTL